MPYPARDGSTIAIKSMVNGLLENNAEVHLLATNTLKHHKSEEAISTHKPQDLQLFYKTVNTNITLSGVIKNLLSAEAFHVSRFKDQQLEQELILLLTQNQYDVVQIEGISMAVYFDTIKKHSNAKITLRAHNAEFQIWERHLQNEKNPLKKWYLSLQNKRLKNFELNICRKVNAIISITEEDKETFKQHEVQTPIFTLPCGMDAPLPVNVEKSADITYLASFDWMPNQQGLTWFLQEVYPILCAKKSDIKIKIGGKAQPNSWIEKYPNITFLDWVDDASEFMMSGKVAMVPLLAGSGMRIKILDNMALGMPMVSTKIGAEGVLLQNRKSILLADSPADFAKCILELLDNEALRQQIGSNALQALKDHYQNKTLGANLLNFYRTLSA